MAEFALNRFLYALNF